MVDYSYYNYNRSITVQTLTIKFGRLHCEYSKANYTSTISSLKAGNLLIFQNYLQKLQCSFPLHRLCLKAANMILKTYRWNYSNWCYSNTISLSNDPALSSLLPHKWRAIMQAMGRFLIHIFYLATNGTMSSPFYKAPRPEQRFVTGRPALDKFSASSGHICRVLAMALVLTINIFVSISERVQFLLS